MKFSIKPRFEAWAHRDIHGLINDGEDILEACRLENFISRGGVENQRRAIEAWLNKAQHQVVIWSTMPDDAMAFNLEDFRSNLDVRYSANQYRRAFVEMVSKRVGLLYEMLGFEAPVHS